MIRKKGKHRQSKRITVMLLPDSSAKIRSMRMPYWGLSVFAVPLLCFIFIISLLQFQVINLESMLSSSSVLLNETIDENNRLAVMLDAAENYLEDANDYTVVQDMGENQHLEELERQLTELMVKSDTIDDMKQGIVGVFNRLAAFGLPFAFDENTMSSTPIAVGGAYTGGLEGILNELNVVLSREILDMEALEIFSEGVESFFRARPIVWPVDARHIASDFGYRTNPFIGSDLERHDGIDIETLHGAEVYATADGIVSFSGWDNEGYGNLIVIEHGYGYTTYYAHNSFLMASVGDVVERGQIIALTGSSGRSMGTHCHYEVRLDNVPQNPLKYLN